MLPRIGLFCLVVALAATGVSAQTLLPAPDPAYAPSAPPILMDSAEVVATPHYDGPGYVSPPLVTLPAHGHPVDVVYRDLRRIHPCAVRQVVEVVNPCGPGCVAVEICAPPGCPRVKVRRAGTKTRLDYGKYAVDIKSRNGRVIVDYDS